jgi:hypothetical protein
MAELGKKLFDERLAALPAVIRDDVRLAIETPAPKRTEVQKYLAGKFERDLRPAGAALEQQLRRTPGYAGVKAIDQSIAGIQAKRKSFPEIRALYDLPGEAVTKLLRRGDYLNPGAEVTPGTLTVLSPPRPFSWAPPGKGARTSGRRLAFARWLTQEGHPLTARVIVNRLWLHHFGEGLVSTPENFGRSGAPPSHPELLDWLATELVRSGWSLKHIHRLIVCSSAYQQASRLDPTRHAEAKRIDPDNRLLWRQRLRRLEAEGLRDAMLAASGSLNAEMFGPPVGVVRKGDGEIITPGGPAGERRSLYLQVRRSQPVTILQVFDQPVIETNCTRRGTSTVSSQALALLNSDFVTTQAEALARRVLRDGGGDPAGLAMRLTFGRAATEKERTAFDAFLAKQTALHGERGGVTPLALADLCHMLLSANEFAYLD